MLSISKIFSNLWTKIKSKFFNNKKDNNEII